jgi:hypothetical protein
MEDNVHIERPITKQEIWDILNLFSKDKSTSPDGWMVEFFTLFFEVVGDDLLEVFEDSRTRGKIQISLNSTFLELIPKENYPWTFRDFRPIALCNLCYKLISKVISNRIKPVLSRALSAEKMGFLKGRQILDAIGTTQECLHNIKKKEKNTITKTIFEKSI